MNATKLMSTVKMPSFIAFQKIDQTIVFLHVPTMAIYSIHDIILIIDVTMSMEYYIKDVKDVIKRLINASSEQEDMRFGIVRYTGHYTDKTIN